MLGDNRDRSAHSRVPASLHGVGMVAVGAIQGAALCALERGSVADRGGDQSVEATFLTGVVKTFSRYYVHEFALSGQAGE